MRLKLLFTAYLVLLTWIVLWKLELPHLGPAGVGDVKAVPFLATTYFDANSKTEIAINVMLFFPFGIFLGALARRTRALTLISVFAVTSLVFECLQFALNIGLFDVTDLIVNTAGASLGLWVVRLAYRHSTPAPRVTKHVTRLCLAGVTVAWLSATAFVISPLHYVEGGSGSLGTHVTIRE